jgi:hypothetical protein
LVHRSNQDLHTKGVQPARQLAHQPLHAALVLHRELVEDIQQVFTGGGQAFKARGVDAGAGAEVLNLLAIDFSEGVPPGGNVVLNFSGGAALRLEVECVEAELADLGPAWAAVRCPGHPDLHPDLEPNSAGTSPA